ncbi:MAG: prolyl oligopeptidase family serine peptidase [Candidatus Sumerlaeia bacterium]|nr:prolyl oligopeptidase family serine peptidase [Candidatus Sumerlaeia bacterium]
MMRRLIPILLAPFFFVSTSPAVVENETIGFALVDAQLPAQPGLYDAPLVSMAPCPGIEFSSVEVHWQTPQDGVKETTGLIINLLGIGYSDCGEKTPVVPDPDWPDEKDVVVATVYYRGLAYRFPYDYGKYQVSDVLRGVGAVLEEFPQLDRRRLYLFGGSGGGHLGLQVLQGSQDLWAEVHIHAAITRITLASDVAANGYATRWNVNTRFPESRGFRPMSQWIRYVSERTLREPQHHVGLDPVFSEDPDFLPIVWMFHGTADPSVAYQHLVDFRERLDMATPGPFEVVSDIHERIGNWNLVTILNGNHSYSGAAPWENTRANASNHHVPNAFTGHRQEPPNLAIDYLYPSVNGYSFHLQGEMLREVTIETVLVNVGGMRFY